MDWSIQLYNNVHVTFDEKCRNRIGFVNEQIEESHKIIVI